jgi:predicted O-methyltransferase YrrM
MIARQLFSPFVEGSPLPAKPVFTTDFRFHVGDVAFYSSFQPVTGEVPAPDGLLSVVKDRDQIDRYFRLCGELLPQVIVEFGIKWGGSTALLHAMNQPQLQLLVSFELKPVPAPNLSAYISTRSLESVVRPYYGVNQADRGRLVSIMAAELSGRKIDLVIDDASHLLDETRASFETLFPLMRPGGIYVIEDWNAEHLVADALQQVMADVDRPDHAKLAAELGQAFIAQPRPDVRLVRLPLELVLARASARDVIREITVMDNWVVIRRGEEPLDPASFRLADLVKDHFKNLRPLG